MLEGGRFQKIYQVINVYLPVVKTGNRTLGLHHQAKWRMIPLSGRLHATNPTQGDLTQGKPVFKPLYKRLELEYNIAEV
jgi:hypothetical protein